MKRISVAIPTYNGIEFIEDLVKVLNNQVDVEIEIVVIDSTSTDGTWEFISSYPNIKSKQILKSNFSHGATRQELTSMATSEFIVFLSQDALPIGDFWALNIFDTFAALPPKIGALLGNQVPRVNAIPAIAQRIDRTFKSLGNEFATSIYEANNVAINRIYGSQPLRFLSDVHVAYRREILLNSVPFKNVSFAEDQLMAAGLLDAGYDIAYAGYIKALHSNYISLGEYAKRIMDETLGVYECLGVQPKFSLKSAVLEAVKNILHGMNYSLKKPRFGKNSLLKGAKDLILVPLYEIQAIRGAYSAAKSAESMESSSST